MEPDRGIITGMNARVLLPVRRWRQFPGECVVASVASVANYYDSDIQYGDVRKLVPRRIRQNGLDTIQQATLLNDLGFTKVSVVTADLSFFDFSWRSYSKPRLINKLLELRNYKRRARNLSEADFVSGLIEWLHMPDCDNRLIIDHNFPKYIRRSLQYGRPVCASVMLTRLLKSKKSPTRINSSPDITGLPDEHAVVLRGFDAAGVYVVDSLNRNNSGYYKMKWESFLVNSPAGDLILVQP